MHPALAPLAIVAGTIASYAVALPLGVPLLVPILNTMTALVLMTASLRRGHVGQAIARMLLWAATLALCATVLGYWRTAETGRMFLNGEAYRQEMFTDLQTGVGAEGNIRQFLPQHALHAGVFSVLALASGSIAAMPMGAALMNYMGFYVGALAAASAHPLEAALLAWVPWALVRIASFVVLGVVFAGPVLGKLAGFPYRLRQQRGWMAIAAAGLVVDAVMKWACAHVWRDMIRAAAGW
jgi:hypothetical protein